MSSNPDSKNQGDGSTSTTEPVACHHCWHYMGTVGYETVHRCCACNTSDGPASTTEGTSNESD